MGGIAYRKAATTLAPVFAEAFRQLHDPLLTIDTLPVHLFETLWVPAAKRQGANTIDAVRDFELPNEDIVTIERMHARLIDECCGQARKKVNQAFVTGGDIIHNLVKMHEGFQKMSRKMRLQFMLMLGCTKGFNLVSHSWINRVLERASCPEEIRRSIDVMIRNQKQSYHLREYLSQLLLSAVACDKAAQCLEFSLYSCAHVS